MKLYFDKITSPQENIQISFDNGQTFENVNIKTGLTNNSFSIDDNKCVKFSDIIVKGQIVEVSDLYYEISNNNLNNPNITLSEQIDPRATKISLPKSTESIENNTFENCNIEEIKLPNTITNISENAFKNCNNLKKVTIETSTKWENITKADNWLSGCPENIYIDYIYLVETIDNNTKTYIKNNKIKKIKIKEGITSIPDAAFSVCTSLTSITIPNSVTSIGSFAFASCSSLTSITIGNSVTSIGYSAFSNCTSLTSINIPDSVTSIGRSAFSSCTSLTSINIPDSVTSIGDFAFYGCTGLSSITIPDSVTSIGEAAFSNCTSLTSISISENNQYYCFESGILYNKNKTQLIWASPTLTSIDIPNSVTSIGQSAFSNCTSLASINIPNSITSIGSSAFRDCTNLTSINIPNSVTSIGDSTFYGCTNLTSINIPDSITSIKTYAFRDCKSLTSIEIPDSVTSIGSYAFEDCRSLTIKYNDTQEQCTWKDNVNNIPIIYLPETLYLNTNDDFNNLSTLENKDIIKTLIISDQITEAPENIFADFTNITSITYTDFEERFNTLFENTGLNLENINININIQYDNIYLVETIDNNTKTYIKNNKIKKIKIKEGITSIPSSAFYGCISLASITIPDSVTSIGQSAFSSCSNLTSIDIPDSVTTIENSTFSGSGLISINIPNSVTSIREQAFWFCSSLTSIIIPDSVTSIGSTAFIGCSNLTSVTIGNSVTSIERSVLSNCTSLTSISISENNQNYYFNENESILYNKDKTQIIWVKPALTFIDIPDSVTSIRSGAFNGCTSLTSINISENNQNYIVREGNLYKKDEENNIVELVALSVKSKILIVYPTITTVCPIPSSNCIEQINFIGTSEQWSSISNKFNTLKCIINYLG